MNNSENKPTNDTPKTYTQQVFHRGMFELRPRSNSFSGNTSNGQDHEAAAKSPTDTYEPATQQQQHPPWQRVPSYKKRKIREDSPTSPTQTDNRFSGLPLDPKDDSIPTVSHQNKPPPIVLYGIEDVNELSKLAETVVSAADFRLKIINKNLLHLKINTTENYKKVIDLVRQKGLIGHTFTRRDAKLYRIVIKNLHHTTPHEAIVEEIEKSGNKVCGEIINCRFGAEKIPTNTFFVNLEPNPNNKAVKDIEYIFHQRVKIENPRKQKTPVQCHRCQQYGHSKNNCMRPYRCLKCAEGHKTSDCPKKDRNTPAKCALCDNDHPANYKGCQVFKEILARKTNQLRPRTRPTSTAPITESNNAPLTSNISGSLPQTAPNNNENPTYAEKTKNQQTSLVEQILIKQSEKIDLLLQQISTLLSLLTAIIPKLTK